MDKKLIVLVGPTAVGKTAAAISLAQKLKTEIVSADSRQIYRETNLGTAKPSPEELSSVRHHFINSHSISEEYDAATYGGEALNTIQGLFQSHDFVIMTGGSGLYVRAVCDGFDDIPAVDSSIRGMLNEEFQRQGIAWLQQKMRSLDPEYFAAIDQQNPHRLIRALEVKIGTGNSIRFYQGKNKKQHPFSICKIGLELNRETLYQRIDTRMDQMITSGLFEEASELFSLRHLPALQTVGYQ